MAHICYDCKLGYGHPLNWCPGCGRKMIKVKNIQWEELRKNNWRLEGDKDLYEYYLDGQPISNDRYSELTNAVKAKYPEIWTKFGLGDYDFANKPTPEGVCWQHGDRELSMYLKNKDFTIYFHKPKVTWRLVGSKLPIENVSMFDEVSFNKDLL